MGKIPVQSLPMGVSIVPDVFQNVMNSIFADIDYVLVYLDDILILSNNNETYEQHLEKCAKVFNKLDKVGMKVNLFKSYFLQKEIDYLGYHLIQDSIAPQTKKWKQYTEFYCQKQSTNYDIFWVWSTIIVICGSEEAIL